MHNLEQGIITPAFQLEYKTSLLTLKNKLEFILKKYEATLSSREYQAWLANLDS